MSSDLTSAGATAHVISADLSHTDATPRLAEQIRAKAGHLDAFYYAPTPDGGFISAAKLTPRDAQGFVRGLPNMSGPGPAQAAQRNYLQSLHAKVGPKGVYVGMLYIGAAIEKSAFHSEMERAKAAGKRVWEMPTVDPASLADLLWTMHSTKERSEATYPERGGGQPAR
jgi:hypothetical protein